MTLFENWVLYKGKLHKMYTQCDNMKKRFEKFIHKNKFKYNSEDASTLARASTIRLTESDDEEDEEEEVTEQI